MSGFGRSHPKTGRAEPYNHMLHGGRAFFARGEGLSGKSLLARDLHEGTAWISQENQQSV
jgi:hypothetical protein